MRRFGDVEALARVSLQIKSGELFSLLGPSGCGKTTLLRIIAGLDHPDEGVVYIGGADAATLPAHQRPVNMVFQSYALFPHLSVWDNIAFGLKMKKVAPSELSRRVSQVIEMVQIEELANRKPRQLSGGQQQRVALARAVVNEPNVLLLDEPLAALDLKLRKELQVELLALQRRLGITFIFVTHDQEEALALSDRIAVFNRGKIEQVGGVESLYEFPQTRFVSSFLGTSNLIEGSITSESSELALASTGLGDLAISFAKQARKPAGRGKVTLAIRPEKVALKRGDTHGAVNSVEARVLELLYIGSETHYILQAGEQRITAEVMNTGAETEQFELGQAVTVSFPPSALIVLDD